MTTMANTCSKPPAVPTDRLRFWSHNRWGYFPSGSVGWRISQENFWEPMRQWWNNAKIRFSIGSLGNQQVSDYLFVQKINTNLTNGDFTFNGTDKLTYAREDAPVANDLTWEKVTTYDWGVDLAFLNNRLTFSGDYYVRQHYRHDDAGCIAPRSLRCKRTAHQCCRYAHQRLGTQFRLA